MQLSCRHKGNPSRTKGLQAEFIRMTSASVELVSFLNEFMEDPEILFSMSEKERREIESQMDAILSKMEWEN